MRFVLAFVAATISTSAFAEECKVVGQIAYCHDWTKDKPRQGGSVDWNKPIKQYGIGGTNFNDPGAPDGAVAAPAYPTERRPAYPFGNAVDFGNGVSCQRNGVTINCNQ